MSDYDLGKDIQRILSKLEAIEAKLSCDCNGADENLERTKRSAPLAGFRHCDEWHLKSGSVRLTISGCLGSSEVAAANTVPLRNESGWDVTVFTGGTSRGLRNTQTIHLIPASASFLTFELAWTMTRHCTVTGRIGDTEFDEDSQHLVPALKSDDAVPVGSAAAPFVIDAAKRITQNGTSLRLA